MRNIVLIIGASSDIGMGFIRSIEENCLILAHCHNSCDKLTQLSNQINNKMIVMKGDLSSEKKLTDLMDEIEKKYGVPNKIILLAGSAFNIIRFKNVLWSDFEKDINISLRSSIMILSRFLPKLSSGRGGKVVIMLSSCVIGIPPKALSHYTTIKYALLGLASSLASEYADKNIQINCISPSMIETQFLNNINKRLIEFNAFNHPLKRNAIVDDVIPVIKMLISKDSD